MTVSAHSEVVGSMTTRLVADRLVADRLVADRLVADRVAPPGAVAGRAVRHRPRFALSAPAAGPASAVGPAPAVGPSPAVGPAPAVAPAPAAPGALAPSGTADSVHPPTLGLLAQYAVLAVLATTVGLGPAGWLAGTAFGVLTWALLSRARLRPGVCRWGPADTVTLARATLIGGVAALVADSLFGPVPVAVLVGLAGVALLLDGVDGQVARRTGTTSPLGARFDMETDAALVLVLSVFAAASLGWWVLAIGLPRYGFAVAARHLPWLRRPLPPRFSRKTVAATQGAVLVVASAGIVPPWLAVAALGLVVALLGWSFGRDITWLWRLRQQPAATHSSPLRP